METNNVDVASIRKVLIIGAGRLAWSLIPALQQAGIQVVGIHSRTYTETAKYLNAYSINVYSDLENLPPVDAIFLTVPDSAIEPIALQLRTSMRPDQMLIHTSGSIGLNVLGSAGPAAVLYPMQAFTREATVTFRNPDLPIFVEGNTGQSQQRVFELAEKLSGRVQVLHSGSRRKLHLGAVIACNFSNLMYRLTDELTPEVDFGVFESLIRNQVELAITLGPAAAQTGPAARGDQSTIDAHLEMLREEPDLQLMYMQLSRLINPDISDPADL